MLGAVALSCACGGTPPKSSAAAGSTAGTSGIATDATREVTLPAGTVLPIVLDTAVGSDSSRAEQTVGAHLSRTIDVEGVPALEAGSLVSGVVVDARESGRVKGRAHVAVKFESLTPEGSSTRYPIRTAAIGRTAEGTEKKDAIEIGAPAVGGALIGALVGGKKGALVGTAAGAGAGTAVVLSTRGKEVHLPRGSRLTLRLQEPVTIRVDSAIAHR